jgi:SAM-dependent methyltransferase
MDSTPAEHARRQYAATTANLDARIALHMHSTHTQPWYAWVRDRLPASGDLLEVGAGTGMLWADGASDLRLTLTDSSAAMCARLRAISGARVLRCDATRLPFRPGSFDVVVGNHMLYHLDDPGAGLAEFARVLRPGGRLAVSTNGRDHLRELNALGPAVGRPDLAAALTRSDFTGDSGPARVAEYFSAVTAERYPSDIVVHDPEPILAYQESLPAEPLTEAQRSAVRDLVRARIAEEGCYRIRTQTILISATR